MWLYSVKVLLYSKEMWRCWIYSKTNVHPKNGGQTPKWAGQVNEYAVGLWIRSHFLWITSQVQCDCNEGKCYCIQWKCHCIPKMSFLDDIATLLVTNVKSILERQMWSYYCAKSPTLCKGICGLFVNTVTLSVNNITIPVWY